MRNSLSFLVSTVLLALQVLSGYAQCPTGAINGSSVVSVGSSINLTAPNLPTGGTVTVDNGYRIHRFTSSGTFTVPAGFSGNVGMLVVAGGGGGGSNGGGGGGGGGVRNTNTQALVGGTTYPITVGAGGAAEANGGDSSFGTLQVATGGGRGASRDVGGAAYNGGSGGGGSGASGGNPTGATAGTGSAGQGNNGGNGTAADLGCGAAGGGGGGAGAAGSAASSANGGNGGIGMFDYITGVGVNYAAGGGGGRTCTNTTLGVGGSGIGGNGGGNPTLATNGVANTGSGGGGGGGIGIGGSGGSGVVIVKYIDYASGTWSSSNTGVATVNAAGVVTGVSAGTATIRLTTTCGSFSSKVVTINSTNADLSNFTLSSGTLSPAFASPTTNYTALVTNATSITVTPTKAEANASLQIQVNGAGWAPINSGSASAAVVLNRVKTTVDIRVTAQDGSTTKTYSVTITRVNTLDNAGLGSTTGAAVYSLRRLSSNYSGPAIQVKRSSDNAVSDIGFTSGRQLDTTALKGFVGNSNGYIVIWYDQSGYGRDLFQLLAATQPRLVNGGIIHRLNKLPAIYFGTSNLATVQEVMFPGAVTMVGVAKGTSTTPGSFISKTGTAARANTNYPSPFDFTNNGGDFYIGNAATAVGSATSLANANPRSDISSLVPASVYSFTSQFAAGSTTYSYRNGVQTGAFSVVAYSDNGNSLRMGNRNELTQQGNFYTPEMVMFNTVLSTSERNTLETNQKNTYISADANLSSLSVNKGNLSPAFASATTGYTVTIDKSMLPFTLTAAASHLYADVQLRVNGGTYAPLARNTPSAALPVTVGSNNIEVKVTAQDGSTIKTYTINLIVEQYCKAGISVNNPKISSNNVRYIDNVTFAGINNNSGTTGEGYQDFTSQTGQVTAGGTYTFTATKAPSSNCLIYVWIDYNQDDDFTDTGELIYSTVAIAGPYTSAITIPLTASVGTTRMRIRLVNDSYGGNYTPCGDSYFGQVEDYSLNILPPPAPVCATGMFPANGTDQECLATLSWQAATNAAGYKVYMGSSAQTLVLVSTQTGTTYTPASLLSGSTYYWKVVPYNSAADAPGCNIYSFTKYTCYCSTGTTYADNHRITEVHFAGINNYSYFSGNGYQQFTSSDTGRVMAGTTVPFAAAGNGNGSYSRFLAWIDYNRDGDFDDAGEQIYSNNTAGPYSASITIPVTASIGNTRMRLRLLHTAYSSNFTPCGTNDVGDVEDYTINIRQLAAPGCAAGFSPSDGNELLCSSSLSWQSVLYAEGYKVYTGLSPASLALVSTQTTTTYIPTGLLYGQIYYWKVVPFNSGGEAAGCSTNSFTVQPLACATGISPVNNGSDNCGTSTLSWQPVSCATGYKLYLGTSPAALSLISNQAGTAYSPSGLTGTSTYYWKVVPYNSSGEAAGCSVNSFTKSICYCSASTDYPDGQYISNLNFGGISNNSGTSGGGYQDFTAITGQVTAGGTYNFDVSGTGHLYSRLLAWIDYNGDGDFTDVGELVYSGNRAGPYSSNITIPLTASVGLTRMRVRLDHTTNGYNGTSCGNSWVGQVEDYSINIAALPGCVSGISPADNTNGCFTSLSWQANPGATGYKVYLGTTAASLTQVSNQTGTSYPLSGLAGGGKSYFWKVVPYNANGYNNGCPVYTFRTTSLTTWTGAFSTDWHDGRNWTQCPPDSAVHAVIPAGLTVYPALTSGKATVKNLDIAGISNVTGGEMEVSGSLTLSNGATLTMDGQSILTLQKEFTQSGGTFTATGGTVSFVNQASFTLPALTFHNLIINGGPSAIINIEGNTAANGNLTLIGSGATLQNDNVVTVNGNLEADILQTGTGRIKLISNNLTAHQISGSAAINNLEVDDALGAIMTEDLTVTGALTLTAGNLTTATGKTLFLNGTISEGIDHMYKGKLVKTISVGSGLASSLFGNIGVGFDNTDGGNWGAVTVTRHTGTGSFISNPRAPNVQGINRYWKIEPQFTPSGKTINLTLSWLSDENNGLTFANNQAQVWKSEDNGLTWVPVEGLKPVISNGSLRSVSVRTSNFSLWTISDAMNPLPVTWLYFNGKATAEGNKLSWATASEKDSKAFVVERSSDGRRFEVIAEVKAAGQSSAVQQYIYLDQKRMLPAQKVQYYRLKQLDLNGSFAYSSVVAIRMEKAADITVSPNPFHSSLQVKLPVADIASFKLTTPEGKTLYLKDKKPISGLILLKDLPVMSPGIYLLQIMQGQTVTILKVVKE